MAPREVDALRLTPPWQALAVLALALVVFLLQRCQLFSLLKSALPPSASPLPKVHL